MDISTLTVQIFRHAKSKHNTFESLANSQNCDVIAIAPRSELSDPQFVSRRWGVAGRRFHEKSCAAGLDDARKKADEVHGDAS